MHAWIVSSYSQVCCVSNIYFIFFQGIRLHVSVSLIKLFLSISSRSINCVQCGHCSWCTLSERAKQITCHSYSWDWAVDSIFDNLNVGKNAIVIISRAQIQLFTQYTLLWLCWLLRGHSIAWRKERPFSSWICLKKGSLSVFESIYNWMCQQFFVLNCVSLLVIPLKWQLVFNFVFKNTLFQSNAQN